MFESLKDMGKLMKQAKEMKEKMQKVQKELKGLRLTGRDNSNSVEVIMTGELDCVDLTILNESLLSPSNKKTLERAILNAVNDAANRSKDVAGKRLSEVSGGMNIPGLT